MCVYTLALCAARGIDATMDFRSLLTRARARYNSPFLLVYVGGGGDMRNSRCEFRCGGRAKIGQIGCRDISEIYGVSSHIYQFSFKISKN